jgi:hypothetical protein
MVWISVKDRYPEKDDLYLCCGSTIDWNMRDGVPDTTFTAYYRGNESGNHSKWLERTRAYEDVEVTHWMEIPEIPK